MFLWLSDLSGGIYLPKTIKIRTPIWRQVSRTDWAGPLKGELISFPSPLQSTIYDLRVENFAFESGKPQKWSFQREYNINIQFLIAKISFQLKKWKFWKKIFEKKTKIYQKVKIIFLLDHFDGPQLFVGGRISLENARNGVFRSSRYCLKKSHGFF